MNIIYNILNNILDDDYYGLSKEIEIVKGKNKIKKKWKEKTYQLKRDFYYKIN